MSNQQAVDKQADDLISKKDALALTNSIRVAANELWRLLLEAHERKAWLVLGYESWREYITDNFDMSVQRSYQVIDQGRVIRALEDAAGINHGIQTSSNNLTSNTKLLNRKDEINVSERSAREIKPALPEITTEIRERVEQGEDPVQTTYEVIEAKRKEKPPAKKESPVDPDSPRAELETANARISELESINAELLSQYEEVVAENVSLQAVTESNDQVTAALAEAKKFRELNRIAEERIRGLMNEKNTAIQMVKSLQRKLKAAGVA